MKMKRYVTLLLTCMMFVSMWAQYNPKNPAEPGTAPWKLTLKTIPADVGSFNINRNTSQAAGSNVKITAYNNGNFVFKDWESENGTVVSQSASFTYTMPAKNTVLVARYAYSPSNPDEPSQAVETAMVSVSSASSEGGYTNISGKKQYEIGSTVSLQAYNYSNFKFVNWTADGEIVSTSSSFRYTVSRSVSIVAHFVYSPGNPAEPASAQLAHRLYLKSSPSEGGYFNIKSGDNYNAGTSVALRAYSNTSYRFKNWTEDGEIVSTNSQFSYTMPDKTVTLVANF